MEETAHLSALSAKHSSTDRHSGTDGAGQEESISGTGLGLLRLGVMAIYSGAKEGWNISKYTWDLGQLI